MDVKEFQLEIQNNIKVESLEKMCSTHEAFFDYASNLMLDVGDIEDYNECYLNTQGKNRKKILLDGYYYNAMLKELHLLVCEYEELDLNKILTKNQVDILFSNVLAFLENREMIIEKGEEASNAYQFADYLKYMWSAVKKVRIVVMSNLIVSSRKSIQNIKSNSFEGRDVRYSIWGIDRFHQIVESNASHEKTCINFKEDLGVEGILALSATQNESDDYEAYLSIISGDLLAKLYDEYGSKLLEGNVRAFLQNRGKVNKQIRGTLLSEPTMFFAYNNGIAATASRIVKKEIEGKLYITEIEDLQIVNGGQTTASIFNVKYVEKESNLLGVNVPMKLSVVDEVKAETLIPRISRTSNTQNKVSEADFFSNHPFHIRIEQISKKVYAPEVNGNQYTTTWFYERSRGAYKSMMMKMTSSKKKQFQMKNPTNQVINKTSLAKYHNSYFCKPYFVSKGAQNNFMHFAGSIAKQWSKSDSVFNGIYYRKMIVIAIIFKKLERIVSSASWYQNAFRANIVTYTISKLFADIQNKMPTKTFDFDVIWKIQDVPNNLIIFFEDLTYKVFMEITADVLGRTKNVTEWCKKEECWIELNKNITINLDKIKNLLVDKIKIVKEEEDAKKEQKKVNKLNVQIEAVEKGSKFWTKLEKFGVENKVLYGFQLNIIKIGSNMEKTGIVPSERQAKTMFEILEKMKLEGFKDE